MEQVWRDGTGGGVEEQQKLWLLIQHHRGWLFFVNDGFDSRKKTTKGINCFAV